MLTDCCHRIVDFAAGKVPPSEHGRDGEVLAHPRVDCGEHVGRGEHLKDGKTISAERRESNAGPARRSDEEGEGGLPAG